MRTDHELLIANHTLFCLLDSQSIQQLAGLMTPINVEPGEDIMIEGNPIDCIYFIESGSAEVIRTLSYVDKQNTLDIALLARGAVIGLSTSGFISYSGFQTASVRAITRMKLLKVTLFDFYEFLSQPQIRYPDLKITSDLFLAINFVSRLAYFKHHSPEKLKAIAKKVELNHLPKGHALYQHGQHADACFCLLKGQVKLINAIDSGFLSESITQMYQIFGDAEFDRGGFRQENAQLDRDSVLLILHRDLVKNDFIAVRG